MRLTEKDCELYYCAQAGGGNNFFQGIQHQRGYGFFGDLGRIIMPIAARAGKYLGRHLLRAGGHVLSDVASGTSVRDSARSRLRETSSRIRDDVLRKLEEQRGRGRIKRRRKIKTAQSSSKRRKKIIGRRDIFA